MLISYNWLSELTGTILSPSELRESLTMVGLAIDAVEDKGDDQILDVEVPSNRPDCLSHVGIAREVSVIESGQVTLPSEISIPAAGKTESLAKVEISDPDLCPRYAARIVKGVKIGPSPGWLVKRLESIGQRPINNVADITNYVLHEYGQPLHAFDLSKLSQQRVVVRRARASEELKTLDGVDRKLTEEMLVIADATHAVALAGVMGGEESEISNQTTDVLIESAYFNPDSVRRTARALGMDTEASRRFERGSDYGGVMRAQNRCVELICETAGGVATEDAIDVCVDLPPERQITLKFARVEGLTSLKVQKAEMLRILLGLGFVKINEDESAATFIVPTWRIDVEREEDLVEEIARHTGYHHIGSELPPGRAAGEHQPSEMQRRALRRSFSNAGYDEAINFSFIDSSGAEAVTLLKGFSDGEITLKNPIIEGASRMRPTLIPGLLNSLRNNFNHGQRDVRLFEIGRIFGKQAGAELPLESDALALVASGGALEEGRAQAPRELDFYDVKGALEAAVDAMKLGPLEFAPGSFKHLRAGQSAAIKVDGNEIGSLGRLADETAAANKFRQAVYLGELDLSALLASKERAIQYHPLERFPSVVRDVTLLVDREINFADIISAARTSQLEYCSGVGLVGVYEGPNVPEDKRAVTLRIEYRSDERTLRDDEVEAMHSRLTDSISQTFAAKLH